MKNPSDILTSTELSPEEAYKLSAQQKEQSSSDFLTQLTHIYEVAKKGEPIAVTPPEGSVIDQVIFVLFAGHYH